MLRVNKSHVKECELPLASLPESPFRFYISPLVSSRTDFRIACEGYSQTRLLQNIMLDNTSSLDLNGDHLNWCTRNPVRLEALHILSSAKPALST